VPYLQAFGHTVLAWIWLDVALTADTEGAGDQGRRAACRFFFAHELPKAKTWLASVSLGDRTAVDLPEEAF
jgi:butyryl-CoA dehydrogenase